MKIRIILYALLGVWLFASCFDDEGNYNYVKDRGVWGDLGVISTYIGEEIEIAPEMYYGELRDTMDVSFVWFVKDTVVSTDRTLHFKGEKSETINCYLYVTDNGTGIASATYFQIKVLSPFATGWSVLYQKDGKSEIGHVSMLEKEVGEGVVEIEYRVYEDLYKQQNGGTELGSQPVKFVEHYSLAETPSEVLVIQKGGQGNVELDGNSFQRVLNTYQEFIGEQLPTSFNPTDYVYLSYLHFIRNGDGNLYSRLVSNPRDGFHVAQFNNNPVYIAGGMRVDQVFPSAYYTTDMVILYDGLNKRLLPFGSYGATTTGNIGELVFTGKYPDGYTPLNDMGDMEVIYGASCNDFYSVYGNECDYSMILRDPQSGKCYYQTFHVLYKKPNFTVTLPETDACIEFAGGNLLTENTLFWLLKQRAYLFFTAGTNNDKLYYYDTKKKTVHLYKDFEGAEIAAIHPNKGYTQLGVGLKNGTFMLFDITDATFISGQPELIYSKSGFGEVVDVIYRYGVRKEYWL